MKTLYKTIILLAFISLAQLAHAGFVSSNIPNDLSKSRAVAIGDVNNDGNLDIYVGNRLEQNKLWIGNGDGTFTSSDIPGDDTGNTTDVVMADFNADGNLDIYVLEWYMKNKLWLGNGDGTFTDGSIPTEPDGASSVYGGVAIGDIDNDGDIDIYNVPYGSTTQNTLWLNDGNANFTLGTTVPLDGVPVYYDVVMADLDADGNLDIYQTTRQYNKQNKLWMGNGNGTFTNNDITDDFCLDTNGGCPGGTVSAGDIDNDGDIDLYLTAYYDFSLMNLSKFWINDGSANFTAQTITDDYGYTAQDTELVDIDNDGDLDILIAMYYNRQNIIWVNDGTGNFNQDNIVGDAGHSFALAIGDINNDGALDVYIANGDYGIDDNRLWLQDTQAPVITLNGNDPETVEVKTAYTDAGASCTDNIDVSCSIVTGGSVDVNTVGSYILTYDATDMAGNVSTQITRTVKVVDTTAPIIILNGSSPMQVYINDVFADPGYNCTDNYDTSCSVTVSGTVDTSTAGTYTLSYDAVDSSGNNNVQVTRDVEVITGDLPIISLTGANPQTIEVFDAYSELGATANDSEDGNITNDMVIDSTAVDANIVGSYTVTYNVSDSNGNNATQQSRTVNVVDTQAPVIALNGDATMRLYLDETYTEDGASCIDNYDSSCSVSTSGSVDTSTVGTYVVTYDAMDSSGNHAMQVSRTIEIRKKSSSGGSKRISKAKLDEIFGSLDTEEDNTITESAQETEIKENTNDENNGICEASMLLTQNLKAGARDGRYHSYTKDVVTEVKILQAHMNRLGFNAGIVDGILGPITEGAIKRMQTSLGTFADGYVGPITRNLINNSC